MQASGRYAPGFLKFLLSGKFVCVCVCVWARARAHMCMCVVSTPEGCQEPVEMNDGMKHWNGLINAKSLSYFINTWISDTDYMQCYQL